MTTHTQPIAIVEAGMITIQCAWCLVILQVGDPAKVSHTACPTCLAAELAQLDAEDAR